MTEQLGPAEARSINSVLSLDVRQGHQVANHGFSHQRMHRMPWRDALAEVERTHALLERTVGEPLARDFRPPFGQFSLPLLAALGSRGYRSVFWSMDSRDWGIQSADEIVALLGAQGASGGDVILFHDDYAHTVAALPRIIEMLRDRRLGFGRVRDL